MIGQVTNTRRTRTGLAGVLAALSMLHAGLAAGEQPQHTERTISAFSGISWDDSLLASVSALLPDARLRRVAAHRPMTANFDSFAASVVRPVENEAVGVGLHLRSPAFESWRLEASTRRMPVRPRSVELLDFGAGLTRHPFTSNIHQVRSLGLETDIGSAFGVRVDWNRYENDVTDFHVLGIGFTYRLR